MDLSKPLSSSLSNILPIVKFDAIMYNFMLLFLLGGNKTIGFIGYSLMLSKRKIFVKNIFILKYKIYD